MKPIVFTKHILEQTEMRKKITGHKLEKFLETKFKTMHRSKDKVVKNSGNAKKIIVGNEKIVYVEELHEIKLITYIIRTNADRIEHKMLTLINYYNNKEYEN